jgi:hypothetical protein
MSEITLQIIINNNKYSEYKDKILKIYDKFKEDVLDEITKDIINNKIYSITEYEFGKKKLYLLKIIKNAFSDENIQKITEHYNFKDKIEYIGENIKIKSIYT